MLLEKRVEALSGALEMREAQLGEVLAAAQLDPATLQQVRAPTHPLPLFAHPCCSALLGCYQGACWIAPMHRSARSKLHSASSPAVSGPRR